MTKGGSDGQFYAKIWQYFTPQGTWLVFYPENNYVWSHDYHGCFTQFSYFCNCTSILTLWVKNHPCTLWGKILSNFDVKRTIWSNFGHAIRTWFVLISFWLQNFVLLKKDLVKCGLFFVPATSLILDYDHGRGLNTWLSWRFHPDLIFL